MLALVSQAAEVVSSQTVWEFLESGGPVMVPIAICSVVALAFALERWMCLRRERIVPATVDDVVQMVRDGRTAEALEAVDRIDAPAGRVLRAGLRRHGRPLPQVERAMEDQGHKELEKLRQNIRPVSLIAAITPLLGLLGTVIGIQNSFHLVVRAGMGKPEHLASGIEEALVTTIAGLTVAIPAMLLAFYLNNKVRRVMMQTDELLSPLVEVLAARPGEGTEATTGAAGETPHAS